MWNAHLDMFIMMEYTRIGRRMIKISLNKWYPKCAFHFTLKGEIPKIYIAMVDQILNYSI